MDNLEDLIKEVYAAFGLAYYHSEVLYRGLCVIYSMMTFENKEDITQPRVEEKLNDIYSLTLGQAKQKVSHLLPTDLQQQLEVALEKRNYLAHHFWFEQCHLMFSEQDLLGLYRELHNLSEMFSSLDESLTEYFKPKFEAFGVNDELVQDSMDKLMKGELDESLISQRKPKKQEHIIRVWDVNTTENLSTQIFESEDGCFWQLCDVGLGWTKFDKSNLDGKINEKIQQYLPANINPRPNCSEPWNYEFTLAKGTTLQIRRGKREKSYFLRIKAPKID
ncbi:MAG: hypothetical protein ABI947_16345 [Chloroflexota bacterium]